MICPYFIIIIIFKMYTFFILTGIHAEQSGTPFCGHTDPTIYREVNYGGGNISVMTLLDGKIMDTNVCYIQRGRIPSKCGIGEHTHLHMEEMYYVMSGRGRSTVNDYTWDVGPGDAIPCTLHDSHGLTGCIIIPPGILKSLF